MCIRDRERRKQNDEIKKIAFEALEDIVENQAERENAAAERRFNQQQENLNRQLEIDLEAAGDNAAERLRIQEDFDAAQEELNNEQAEKRKQLALKQARIEAALAILKIAATIPFPANIIPIAQQVILSGIQLAAINAQEFADGGFVQPYENLNGRVTVKNNVKPTKKGDGVFALLKPDEVIFNKRQQGLLEAIAGSDIYNRVGIPNASSSNGTFMEGGFVGGGIPQVVSPQIAIPQASSRQNITVQLSDDQVAVIARTIANETASSVKDAVGQGLGDATRRIEREQILSSQTGI